MSKNGKPHPGIGQMIALAKIVPCPLNPRRTFDKDKLAALATSIAATGVQVPLIVRPVKRRAGHFELVDGERRYRAAKIAELVEVPAIVRELTDAQVLEAMLVVEVQRADIDDLERADGIFKLHTELRVPLEDIATRIGRSVSTIRHLLRLRDLPKIVRRAMQAGELPTSTAMAIARVPGTAAREKVARLVLMGEIYGNGEGPTDADLAARQKDMECAPLNYRDARKLIAKDCYRGLDGAPFSRQSLDLIPAAGSCDACPKRAGNLKEDPEYAHVREDMCIDPECYEAKITAHTALMLTQYEESGTPVIAGDEARKLFDRWNPTQLDSHDWVDLDKKCGEDRKNRTYEKLIGKSLADQVRMAMDPAGTFHRLVPAAAATKALKDQGIKTGGGGGDSGGDSSWQRGQAKQRVEDQKEAARRSMGLVAEMATTIAWAGFPPTGNPAYLKLQDMLRLIVEGVIDRTWDHVSRQVKMRRKLAPKTKERSTSGGNKDLVAELPATLDVPDLIGLIAELVAGEKAMGFGDGAKAWWEFFDVDPKAVLAEVKAARVESKDAAANGEAWRNVTLTDMGLRAATEKLMRKKGYLQAGDVADFVARTTPATGRPSRLREEILKAIEILRSEHKPGAVERAAARQQEQDADFDFAEKEAADV